jgi:hypothetical protein
MELSRKHQAILLVLGLALLVLDVKTAKALTKAEIDCGVRSTYHEARSLSPEHWDRVFKVAVNRKKHPKRYGAKSANLCDIVHSKQYATRNRHRIKEPKMLAKITKRIQQGYWASAGNYNYFRSRRGRMFYRS